MKKIACIFVVICLLILVIGNSFSEVSEKLLTDLSLDELLELRNDVESLIQEKQKIEEEFELLPGIYTIGKDIPEGSYIIKIRKLYHNFTRVTLRESTRQYITQNTFISDGQQLKIDLNDGNILELDSLAEYTIKKVTPLF